jgi:hypothetical protein
MCISNSPRTAREVVELYNLVVWNQRDFALAEELLGDTVTRHEVGAAILLTHREARMAPVWTPAAWRSFAS